GGARGSARGAAHSAGSASGCGPGSGAQRGNSRLNAPVADVAKTAPLAERLVAGEKRALARAITLIESDDPAGWDLVREVYPRTGRARLVASTAPPARGNKPPPG